MSGYTKGKIRLAIIHEKTAVPPTLESIILSGPSSVTMTHNSTAYTAVGKDGAGNTFNFAPIFQSSVTSKATIDSSSGIATPVAAGTTNITVHATNALGQVITSNAITLTVNAQVATTVTVTPSSFTIADNGTQQLAATVYDQDASANIISGASISWSSGTPAKATVNSSTGLVSGVSAGSSRLSPLQVEVQAVQVRPLLQPVLAPSS